VYCSFIHSFIHLFIHVQTCWADEVDATKTAEQAKPCESSKDAVKEKHVIAVQVGDAGLSQGHRPQ
jgi:hypothetical protein